MQYKMNILKYFMIVLAFFLNHQFGISQEVSRFQKNIDKFKQQDSIYPPTSGSILMIGSSSFTNWKDVQSYFPDYKIINRGFGGSRFPDLIRHAEEVIYPYHPKQILVYCGDNDLMAKSATPQIVFNDFKTLYYGIRKKLGSKVLITFISIKPSPRRKHLMPYVMETNTLIREFLKKEKNTVYVDVYSKMLEEDGSPIKAIFLKDSLHMNASGYAIWQKAIAPILLQ